MSKLLNIAIALVAAFFATYLFCAAASALSGASLFACAVVFIGVLWFAVDRLESAA